MTEPTSDLMTKIALAALVACALGTLLLTVVMAWVSRP